MTRAALLAAVRAWLVLAGASGGIPNADRAVIFADQDLVRPALPCLVVRMLVYDIPVGEDFDLYDAATIPNWRARGLRTSTVSINAFGAGAEDWLERAVSMLRAPSVLAQLSAAGYAVRPLGGLDNLSALLDDKTQVRFHRDFAVDYERTTETEAAVELGTVVHTDEWQGQPSTRTVTVTEVL